MDSRSAALRAAASQRNRSTRRPWLYSFTSPRIVMIPSACVTAGAAYRWCAASSTTRDVLTLALSGKRCRKKLMARSTSFCLSSFANSVTAAVLYDAALPVLTLKSRIASSTCRGATSAWSSILARDSLSRTSASSWRTCAQTTHQSDERACA